MRSNDSISVVFSTRKIDNTFIDHIKKSCLYKDVEVLPYENNGEFSLTEIYNRGLVDAKNDIIVFCHDDIIIETNNWGDKLLKAFNKNPDYGILGVAGTNHLINGMWWQIKNAMHGTVKHTDGIKVWENKYSENYGNQIKEMIVIDGLFIAVDRKKLESGFDERFKGFHFYDLSFCINNYLDGVDVGLISNIKILHKSIGQVNKQWGDNKLLFEEIYSDELPICLNENNKHVIFDSTLPKIDLHVLCWNEEKIIPHFLKHYENIVSKIIVYDNKSNDNSVKLLKTHPKVTIVPYDTNGEIRDDAYLQIKNNAWKQSKDCDIVIVCDMDEFLYSDNLPEYMKDFKDSDSTIIKPEGFDMIIKDFDITKSEYILNDVQFGFEHTHFNKLCVFKPNKITDINYNFGCHVANPKGIVIYHDKPIKLLHFKKIGLKYYLDKMRNYHKRVSKFNKDRALGFEYSFSVEKHREIFNLELDKIKKVL